jgi:hypothetical protein
LLKGGTVNRTIASFASTSKGVHSWKIPSNQALGGDYSIRITSKSNGSCTDISDSNFTIVGPSAPAITIVSPNGEDTWLAGSTQSVQWSYTGNFGGFVKVELLKGGVVTRTITSFASVGSGGNGSYNWKIPSNQTLGSDYKIRVTSRKNSAYTDTSNNDFSIN